MAAYFMARMEREYIHPNFIKWSLPSLLFPLACFSFVGILPVPCGGCGGSILPAKYVWPGVVLAILGFEVFGPMIGRGIGDWKDSLALACGGAAYLFLTRNCAKA